jgi:hypothetical protein
MGGVRNLLEERKFSGDCWLGAGFAGEIFRHFIPDWIRQAVYLP